MDQPFCLLVYDNHTDMQPPAFGGILPCGGWIAAALEELENLKYVILVGPDEAAYEQVDENLKDRVIFLSREKLQVMNDEERNWFLRETVSEVCNWRKSEGLQEDAEKFLPLYISVDKDVLCTEDAQTTWEPGGYEADNFGVRCTDCIGMCKRKQWKDCRCGYLRRSRCGSGT